jgi:hypothetical protein
MKNTYDTIGEALNEFWEYKPNTTEIPFFTYTESAIGWRFGDYFLFQHINENKEIGRPRLGIFVKWNICDQALAMLFIENDRAWMSNTEIVTNKDLNIKLPMNNLESNFHEIIFWYENIHLLGHWNRKPTISQLKESLCQKI